MSLAPSMARSDDDTAPSDVRARLASIGQELTRALGRPTFLDRLCSISVEALDARTSCILLRDARSGRFLPVARRGAARSLGHVSDPSHALADEISRRLRHESVFEAAARTDGPDAHRSPVRWLCIALRRGNRLVGMVLAGRRATQAPFSGSDWAIAEGIGRLASLCLENIRLSAELAHVKHIKTDFVSTMSHELRTPLNIILGYLSLLLEGDFGALSDEQASALRHVDRSAHTLFDLIQSTLDLSRLERETLPIACGEIVVADFLASVARDAEGLPHDDAVAIRWHAQDDAPVVRTDPGKLRIVLKNLVSNALKFTAAGAVDVHARACGNGVEFSVTDHGVGVPRGDLGRIFEPFTQLGKASTRTHGGIGMGLYVARRLTEMLGGTIAVSSRVGSGSTFRVWIPASAPTEGGDHSQARSTGRSARDLGEHR
ncbi:GAF domain-containing sensor histidine kinase [Candidatus Binatia bacterium]|nr:GAF domain-containing sensor histidine kinase [Candidatus Binatia bacterium]